MPPPRTFARPVVSRDNAGAFPGEAGVAGRNAGTIGGTVNRPAMSNERGNQNLPNRGAPAYTPRPNSSAQMPDRGSAGPRYVPRPPSAGGMAPEGRTYQSPTKRLDKPGHGPGQLAAGLQPGLQSAIGYLPSARQPDLGRRPGKRPLVLRASVWFVWWNFAELQRWIVQPPGAFL